jgi:hypothetical protein
MKYQYKQRTIEAVQWFKMGDHGHVEEYGPSFTERKKYRCGALFTPYGIPSRQVCPGDWIVTDAGGTHVMSDKEFRELYEPVTFDVEAIGVDEKFEDYGKLPNGASFMSFGGPVYGKCPVCGEVLTIDHECPEWVTK